MTRTLTLNAVKLYRDLEQVAHGLGLCMSDVSRDTGVTRQTLSKMKRKNTAPNGPGTLALLNWLGKGAEPADYLVDSRTRVST